MSYTDQYKEIVKEFHNEFPDDGEMLGFETVAAMIGYKFPKSSQTSSEVCDEIARQIKVVLSSNDENAIDHQILYSVLDQLSIEHLINSPKDDYRNELYYILDSNKETKYVPLTNKTAWKKALKYVLIRKKMRELPQYSCSNHNLRIADCISLFRKKCWCYTCEDGVLSLDDEGLFFKCIDDSVLDIGLKNVLDWMFGKLAYSSITSLFVIKRVGGVMPKGESQIPYGYLLNRVLHLAQSESFDCIKPENTEKIKSLECLLKQFTSYIDVLPHNPFESMIPDSLTPKVLNRWIRYDWLVDILQYPYNEIDAYMDFLSKDSELNAFASNHFGYSLKDFFAAIEDIQFALDDKKVSIVNSNDLAYDCNPELLSKIMDENSVSVESVNKDFQTYRDIVKIDYYLKPFIRLSTKQYLLLPKSLMSIGFYETIAEKFKKFGFVSSKGKSFDSYIGTCIEKYIEENCMLFKKRDPRNSIELYSNELYDISEEDKKLFELDSDSGECDIVIGTKNKIYLIESKKKNLCRKSYNGHVVNAFLDLSRSLFASQKQCLRHELLLRKNGKLSFKSGKTLFLKERSVIRISVSAFDFKSLQSKILAQNMLNNSVNIKFISDEISYASSLAKINLSFEEISHLIQKGIKNKLLCGWRGFHDSCWFNMFQFAFLLKTCKNSESFEKEMSSVICLSQGYYNFWNEWAGLHA